VDLGDFVEDVSLLIDSAPEIAFFAIDSDDDLIEMPYVVARGRLAFETTGVVGAEFDRPALDRFVGYDNAALRRRLKGNGNKARRRVR
jgi:hypothetical protein